MSETQTMASQALADEQPGVEEPLSKESLLAGMLSLALCAMLLAATFFDQRPAPLLQDSFRTAVSAQERWAAGPGQGRFSGDAAQLAAFDPQLARAAGEQPDLKIQLSEAGRAYRISSGEAVVARDLRSGLTRCSGLEADTCAAIARTVAAYGPAS